MKILRLFQAQVSRCSSRLDNVASTYYNNNNYLWYFFQAACSGVMLSVKFLDDNSNGISNWDSLEVLSDPHKLAQIFSNVISNSLKVTPRNGSIEIQISTVPCPRISGSGSTTSPSIFSWFSPLFYFPYSSTTAKPPVVTNMVKFDIIDSGIGISQVLFHYLTLQSKCLQQYYYYYYYYYY